MGIKFDKWTDKNTHMVAGTIITIICGLLFFYFINDKIIYSLITGLFFGITAGALKEWVIDKYITKGVVSLEDFLATVWGSLVGFIILIPILVNL